jgi:hypothetical protein
VNIRLVQLYRFRQVVDAKRCMAHGASFPLGLRPYDANTGREY